MTAGPDPTAGPPRPPQPPPAGRAPLPPWAQSRGRLAGYSRGVRANLARTVDPRTMRRQPLVHFERDSMTILGRSLKFWGVVAAVVLVAVSAGFGGLATAKPPGPRHIAAGTAVDAGEFRITVLKARFLPATTSATGKIPPTVQVLAATTAINRRAVSSDVVDALSVAGVATQFAAANGVSDNRDGSTAVLNPNVTIQAVYSWTVTGAVTSLPASIQVSVPRRRYYAELPLEQTPGWLQTATAAIVTVPLPVVSGSG